MQRACVSATARFLFKAISSILIVHSIVKKAVGMDEASYIYLH